MANVDELIVKIKADTKGLKKGLDGVNRSLNKTSKTSKAAGAAMKRLGALAAVYFSAKTVGAIFTVTSSFEDLKDSLDTVFGSMKAGDKALDTILKFAQTTPFQIETVTEAFIALKSAGIEPTTEMLRIFGNTATLTTDKVGTFQALIKLTQRSASGGLGLEELNMISDRGIDVLGILADKLDLAKDEIATFGKTSEGARIIVKALMDGLNEKFPDTMGRYMDNLSTKSSNATISFKRLAQAFAEVSGASGGTKAVLDFLAKSGDDLRMLLTGEISASDFFPSMKGAPEEPKKKKEQERFAGPLEYRTFAQRNDIRAGGPEKRAAAELLVQEKRRQSVIKFAGDFASLASDAADPLVEIAKQIAFIASISESQQEMDLLGTNPEQLAEITAHLNELSKEATETSDTIGLVLAQSISDSAQAFSTTFVDGIMSGRSALASFGDFAKDIVKQIIATFLQMAIVNKILNRVFGGMGGFTTLDTIGGAAGGGTVQAGRPTLVGERGAEIFVPNSSGRIMNNADSQGGGGGGVVINQSINFSTGVVATVRAEVGRMMPQIADTTKAAVLEASQRGGSFRKGLMGAT